MNNNYNTQQDLQDKLKDDDLKCDKLGQDTAVDNGDDSDLETSQAADCPSWLPEKFFKSGITNVEALAKSYTFLEKRLSQSASAKEQASSDLLQSQNEGEAVENTTAENVDKNQQQNTCSDYEIDLGSSSLTRDSEFEKVLQDNDFNNLQAQTVYDLANEYISPLVEQISDLNLKVIEGQLENEFGGREAWQNTKSSIYNWGCANLPKETMDTLSTTVQGVKTLHKLMEGSLEHKFSSGGDIEISLTAVSLRKMMDNPKYWRDKDPEYIKRVQAGFKQLYPDN